MFATLKIVSWNEKNHFMWFLCNKVAGKNTSHQRFWRILYWTIDYELKISMINWEQIILLFLKTYNRDLLQIMVFSYFSTRY